MQQQIPSGMTDKKSKGKDKGKNSSGFCGSQVSEARPGAPGRFPSGMTDRKAKAKADPSLRSG
jgi:hypothetical protein